jgi:hypothetical protein
MSRIRNVRTLVLIALLAAFAVPAVSNAQAPPPFSFTFMKLIQTVTVIAPGETESDAIDNALLELEADYRVLSYTVLNSFCTTDDPPGPIGPFTICAAEVEARVIRKLTVVGPH